MGGSTKSLGFDVLPAATRVTQGFGCTDYNGEWLAPWCGADFFHAGVDLAADDIFGKPVYTTRSGVVVANQDPAHRIVQCAAIGGQVVFEPYLGVNAVVVQVDEDGRRVWMEFGHLNSAAVRPGDRVEVGDVVGYVGTHGASCGSHLHLEVRTDGPWQGVPNHAAAVIDPTSYLMASGGKKMTRDDWAAIYGVLFVLVLRDPPGQVKDENGGAVPDPVDGGFYGEDYYWADETLRNGPRPTIRKFLDNMKAQAAVPVPLTPVPGPAGPPGEAVTDDHIAEIAAAEIERRLANG